MTDNAVDAPNEPVAAGRPRRVTIVDVAARAGVSAGLVSFALNDRPGVAEHTRRRILDAAADLGWQPSHRGRSLKREMSFTLGLVLARSQAAVGADPFFPAFVAGVSSVLEPLRRALVFTVVPGQDAELETYRRLAGEQRVDGVFLTDLRVGDPRPGLVAALGLPAITLGQPERRSGDPRVGSVSVDDVPGVREVVAELVAQGHRRIAHVTGPDHYLHVVRRKAAWADALADAGLPPGPCEHTDFSAGDGARATERLLDARTRPTAIVYANDLMAIAGLAVAQRRGISVPTQLSITGFDDTELTHHLQPPLTSVRTDVEGWGRHAAQALLAAIGSGEAQHVDLPSARMVPRESVAPPPAARKRATAALNSEGKSR